MRRITFCAAILCLMLSTAGLEASRNGYVTAYNYTIRFYPRWLSWVQFQNINQLSGPIGMGPEYKVVVAINDDTLYASAPLDLRDEPLVLTVPKYDNIYSILQLDVFGNIFETELKPSTEGGTYIITGPDYEGAVPAGMTQVHYPYNSSLLIFRVDKYSPENVDLTSVGETFRSSLKLTTLSKYQADPGQGQTVLLSLFYFRTPVKRMADDGALITPINFLETLQQAMDSETTTPLTKSDKTLIKRFNNHFKKAKDAAAKGKGEALLDITEGTRAAHASLIDNWQSTRKATNWVHFDNIGHWGDNYLDRASLTEYIQWGNDRQAAFYAHAFVDGTGIPLNGKDYSYTITFTKDQLPEASRFWSLTAYTPIDVQLVENTDNKYVVASYTPGLVKNADGGVTIYLQTTKPSDALVPNWLPIPSGPFSVMLRIYGPEGAALLGTYLPPKIEAVNPY